MGNHHHKDGKKEKSASMIESEQPPTLDEFHKMTKTPVNRFFNCEKKHLHEQESDINKIWRTEAMVFFGFKNYEDTVDPPIPEHFRKMYCQGKTPITANLIVLYPGLSELENPPTHLLSLYGAEKPLSLFESTFFDRGQRWPDRDFFQHSYSGHGVQSYAFGTVCFIDRIAVFVHIRYSADYNTGLYFPMDRYWRQLYLEIVDRVVSWQQFIEPNQCLAVQLQYSRASPCLDLGLFQKLPTPEIRRHDDSWKLFEFEYMKVVSNLSFDFQLDSHEATIKLFEKARIY